MKITMISEEDVKVIRAAKKVLKKLQKKEIKLNAAEDLAIEKPETVRHYGDVALPHWRFLDELDYLGVHVDTSFNGELSLICPAPEKGKKK